MGGFWSNITDTCSLQSDLHLDTGDSIKVEKGASLTIIGAWVIIHSSNRVDNYGTINNSGQIDNYGLINNYEGSRINLGNGTKYEYEVTSLANWGTINNSGNIFLISLSIWSWRTIENSGTIDNNGGKIYNTRRAHIDTSGIINNKGNINNGGRIDNTGILDNYNGSRIYNSYRGTFTSLFGSRIVNMGTIFSLGLIEIQGDIENKGVIDSYGPISNDGGTIKNNSSGIIINHGSGSFKNSGLINNYGNITTIYGDFSNEDIIQNNCGAAIIGTISGNSVINTCTSTTTLATTITKMITSTTSIEQVVEPASYIWAVGATVAVVLLTIMILRKRINY
jgi:hypothetical protein